MKLIRYHQPNKKLRRKLKYSKTENYHDIREHLRPYEKAGTLNKYLKHIGIKIPRGELILNEAVKLYRIHQEHKYYLDHYPPEIAAKFIDSTTKPQFTAEQLKRRQRVNELLQDLIKLKL